MAWYHEDGTICVAGHLRDGLICMEGGGPVHSTNEEIARIRREMSLVERVSRETTEDLTRRIMALERAERDAEPLAEPEGGKMLVYIPEAIFVEDNPWDGRTRYGVHMNLPSALANLENVFGEKDKHLKATKSDDTSGGSSQCIAVFMVHREDEEPRREGNLWIFVERVSR